MMAILDIPITLETCTIRDWERSDAIALADIEFDPEVKQYLGESTRNREEYIAGFMKTIDPRGLAIEVDKQLAGTIERQKYPLDSKKMELRILLAREFRGKGIAYEVVNYFVGFIFEHAWVESVIAIIHSRKQGGHQPF